MVKNASQKPSILVKLILILSVVSFLVLLLTPTIFVSNSSGLTTVWGWTGIFGVSNSSGLTTVWGWTGIFGGTVSAPVFSLEFEFNWTIYLIWLIGLVIGVMTYYIGPKHRGFYIFAAIVFVLLSIFIFTIGSSWIQSSWISGNGEANKERMALGVGPWTDGFLAIIMALISIVEFRLAKTR